MRPPNAAPAAAGGAAAEAAVPAAGARTPKKQRRAREAAADTADDPAARAAGELQQQHGEQQPAPSGELPPGEEHGGGEQQQHEQQGGQKAAKKKNKLLSEEKLRRLKQAADRRGIVYVSRLPPHMKPAKLRQLLSPYGEVGRIYCTPEDTSARQARKRKGGNSGKNFTEGWVEFEDKADAKRVAAALNGEQVGGRRRSAYHYDLWNLKYLPKFKWDHLTEEIAYERAVREQRMAQELAAAKRERDFYLSRVDRAKAAAAMQQRRAAKQQQQQQGSGEGDEGGGGEGPGAPAAAAAGGGLKRAYGQRKVKPDPSQPDAPQIGPDVLGMLVVGRGGQQQQLQQQQAAKKQRRA